MKRNLLLLAMLFPFWAFAGPSSDLQKIMTPQKAVATESVPNGYVFVSTQMDDSAWINLARQAQRYGFSIVLNGFGESDLNTRQRINQVIRTCCEKAAPTVVVHPQLFRAYKVTATPTFVIAKNDSGDPGSFSKVTGSMSVQDALGVFYNKSRIEFVRLAAARIYRSGENK